MAGDPLLKVGVQCIGQGLLVLAIAEHDVAAFEDLIGQSQQAGYGSYMELAVAQGRPLTPAMWAIYLRSFLLDWESVDGETAASLPAAWEKYAEKGDSIAHRVSEAATDALATLLGTGSGAAVAALDREAVMLSFYRFAKLVEEAGNPDIAYNLMAIAIDGGPPTSTSREEVVRYGLGLASAANRPHQIAACSAHLALTLAHAADHAQPRRLEAFDSLETALERIRLAPESVHQLGSRLLLQAVAGREYLAAFASPLCLLDPANPEHGDVAALLKSDTWWPDRISSAPRQDWLDPDGSARIAQLYEMEFDLARLALVPPAHRASVGTDWMTGTFEHPAYRRCVPHNRSFMREADFDSLFLVLSHETTHVLSLIGSVGNALNCLRVAAYHTELALWAGMPGTTPDGLRDQVARHGPATPKDGDAGHLFRAEQSAELALKAKMLQDVWTPWFEGLAVFGEMAADPTLDRERTNPVTEALRNLVDAQWLLLLQPDSKKAQSDVAEFIVQFEKRCSQAITQLGPTRLGVYVTAPGEPYLAGYAAVRSVVASWRATRQVPLSGTEAFMLLLSATRYDTTDAVPDLSLRSDLFRLEAEAKMSAWAARLAGLDAESLGAFLDVPTDEIKDFRYDWEDGHLAQKPRDPEAERRDFAAEARRRLSEAFASLTRPEDLGRIVAATPDTSALLEIGRSALEEHFATADFERLLRAAITRVGYLGTLSTLLPIGSAKSRFFINLDPGQPEAMLGVQLLTTEKHVEDAKPSINAMYMDCDRATAQCIAASYSGLADPRLEVTRVIDLGGVATADPAFVGTHVFALHYDHRTDVRGPMQVGDLVIRHDPENLARLRELVRARLYPDPLEQREIEMMARGEPGARRTSDWLARSNQWKVGDVDVDVADWAARLKNLAEQVLDATARRPRRQQAAAALLAKLFNDAGLVQALAYKSFADLIWSMPSRLDEIVLELFRTAQQPTSDPATAAAASALADCGFPLLVETSRGWDMRAAISGATKGGKDAAHGNSQR
jgi:hypothetical protein